MLRVEKLEVAYGKLQALWGVTFDVQAGEIVALVGANGAGKTTTLKSLSGLLRPKTGSIWLGTERLDRRSPPEIAELGVVHVPEGRKLFPGMSVLENLLMGGYTRPARPHAAAG
jgi:branched-chain amino acid transport system ATP-binding protein